jgi:hypothetical protein
MTCATRGAGLAYPSGTAEFSGVRVARSLIFSVAFCISLFVLLPFLLGIVLSVLLLITPFGIFKLFLE